MAAARDESITLAGAFPFAILEEAGEGTSSRVFRARDLRTDRIVALKIGKAEASLHLFAHEAARLSRACSPLFPEVVDLGVVPATAPWRDAPFLALSFVEGAPLDVRAPRSPSERRHLALAVARDVGEALAALHDAGASHGDIKPANIVVRRGPEGAAEARVVDLGLVDDADSTAPLGGTPRYLARERWARLDLGDGRARDLLALGLVLAEILEPEVAEAEDALRAASIASFPRPFDGLIPALLDEAPGARPRASWVAARALAELGGGEPVVARRARAPHRIRAAYLASRAAETAEAARQACAEVRASGEAGRWLSEAIALSRRCELMLGGTLGRREIIVEDADELCRLRWLVSLMGPAAAAFPLGDLPPRSDAAWAEALLTLAVERDPMAWGLEDLERALGGRAAEAQRPSPLSSEPGARATRLALALAASPPDRRAILAVEAEPSPPELVRTAADALRRLGEYGRALALLRDDASVDGLALRAEISRRAGDPERAMRWAREALAREASHGDALFTLARVQLDAGALEDAEGALLDAPASARVQEARALLALRRGDLALARREADRGEALASTDEARARLAGLLGYLAHARGDAPRAMELYRRASEDAARAGALVEEATYRTGEAASATDAGHLEAALAASTRASLLWDHLDRGADAARALLARAASFATAGARHEACASALEARERARSAGDLRAEAFTHWPVTDVLEAGSPEAVVAARRAFELLRDGTDEDKLRALARLLRHAPEEVSTEDLAFADRLARTDPCAPAARLEWWGARALGGRGTSPSIVREVVRLLDAPASIASRGPALGAASKLAAEVFDGDSLRLLVRAQADAVETLRSHAPGALRESIAALPWVRDARGLGAPSVSAEQIVEFERLIRALGSREALRPLLEQVLDALILWTGVERGLLLLAAPGGKLVPRVARNLQRKDLEGEQRHLSRSLAERALALGEPVVAVDAAGELADLHQSVMALKLRSVLAVPLLARGESLGVVYLDDRMRRGAFGPRELSWVRLVASLASFAIADARDQLLLRRAIRRAERAKARLAEELAEREAALESAKVELAQRDAKETRYRYEGIVGKSEPLRAMLSLLDRVTPTSVPVLLIGESGSGKELVARALHRNGPRQGRPFVSENCGAIPEPLLESTLFGHVRGAFTGADRPRAGLFEIADKGTLFLDEIGEMPLSMQTKLLRVLETGEVRPVGSERGRKVDVRILAATHRDLRQMVREGRFREDLFYRLDVITVPIPSLRDRRGDIPLLVSHLVAKHASGERVRVSKEAMRLLSSYPFPGNVRQLENEIRRALVLSDGVILPEHLSQEIREDGQTRPELGLNLRARLDALSVELLRQALEETQGNQTKAAERLGLSRFGLQKMMKRLEIEI